MSASFACAPNARPHPLANHSSTSKQEVMRMQLTMHELATLPLLRSLGALSGYVDAAESFAKARNIEPAVLIKARLFPDMLPFSGQIQRASDTSKARMGRLTGMETLSSPDNEHDFNAIRLRSRKPSTSFNPCLRICLPTAPVARSS